LYALLDGNKSVSCGVMRGLSQEIRATMASLVGYYLIGCPCELIFGFAMELGVLGLWIGQMCGSAFHLGYLAY
jgi:multidrug resistance protein, MATE family